MKNDREVSDALCMCFLSKVMRFFSVWSLFLGVLIGMAAAYVPPAQAKGTLLTDMHPGKVHEIRNIRIAVTDYQGFINKDENGVYKGYGVDLLHEISKYTGWKYTYVFDTFANSMAALRRGEVDFICHAQYTPERGRHLLFSKYPSGSEAAILYARNDDNRYYYNDFASYNGIVVGMLAGSFQNGEFANFALKEGFKYTPKYYPTQNDAFSALKKGEIDTVSMGSLGGINGFKVLSRFSADPFYFATGKMNRDLIEKLDFALAQIAISHPMLLPTLFDLHYGSRDASSGVMLTRSEAHIVKTAEPVTVALSPDFAPLSFENGSGNAEGILVDMMNLLGKKTGLRFNFVLMPEGASALDFLKDNPADLVMSQIFAHYAPAQRESSATDVLLSSKLAFAGKSETKFTRTSHLSLALPTTLHTSSEEILKRYPNFTIINASSPEQCLKLVRDGDADITLQDVYFLRNALQSPVYEGIGILPSFEISGGLILIGKDKNVPILSIINKSIETLTMDDVNEIILRHTIKKPYQFTFSEFLYKYRIPLTGMAALLGVILILSMIMIVIRRRNFQALSRLNAQLNESYQNITRKNEQLALTVEQADSANRAKSQFLARMSHEIRTPMNAIVGLTTIAQSHLADPERIDDCLSKLAVSSHVLLSLINDVLDMSAIENNKIKIDASQFDIKDIFNDISTLYYPQCNTKGIHFSIRTNLPHEFFIGDRLRINQILLNFISNAYKFTDAGGSITIDVQEEYCRDDVAYICFIVQDTGIGIAPDLMSRLFKPFEQESSKTALNYGGSGLGLSIAKALVDMMHGNISVTSEKGKGTTFRVNLPLTIAHQAQVHYSPEDIKHLRVLVVDDDSASCEYIGIILSRIGVPFSTAHSGEQAISMLRECYDTNDQYDVCLVDWKMPDIDGISVTRYIRKLFDNNTLVIILSAYDLNEVESQARSAGADLFITKPIFQSAIFNVLMQRSGGFYGKITGTDIACDFTGHTVLLAEDNSLNAEIAIELLRMVNMQVKHALNGQQAVDLFLQSEPGTYCAILMDIQMPCLSGYEATQIIRQSTHPQAQSIPIIAMTANAFESDVTAALNAGMNGHIAKPIDVSKLYTTLQDIVSSSPSHVGSVAEAVPASDG